VAELLDLGEDVAGQQNRGATLGHLLYAGLKSLFHQRVKA
jgi:hypothetical protein